MDKLQKIQAKLNAPKGQKNNYGNYKYRTAEDILEAVKPLLDGCLLTLNDEVVLIPCEEDRVVKVGREDRVIHVGGRYFVKSLACFNQDGDIVACYGWAEIDRHPGMSMEQCCGSASSYARKTALCGLFGISDSGNDPDAIDNRPRTQQPAPLPTPQQVIAAATTIQQLVKLWNTHPEWQTDEAIMQALTTRKQQLYK